MNRSMILSFNSLLIVASALCTSIVVTPPALAETCMTDSLMMVYEPIETVRPRLKKRNGHAALANSRTQSQLTNQAIQRKPLNTDTPLQASATKPVLGKQQSKGEVKATAESKTDNLSSIAPDALSGTHISHAAVAER